MRSAIAPFVAALMWAASAGFAVAAASGPDSWDVSGVEARDTLSMHATASARSKVIARIPHDAKGLKNLGCRGAPSFQQWTRMGEAERARASRSRWCRVSYQGKTGWVAGRYLREGATMPEAQPQYVGAWTLKCSRTCWLEQPSVGANRPTLLKLRPVGDGNAEITIERRGIAKTGTLTVYMDGEAVSAGPIAPLAANGPGRLVMDPDDITMGLKTQMGRHKRMVLSFPGEERGAEYGLDQFDEAWRQLAAPAKR